MRGGGDTGGMSAKPGLINLFMHISGDLSIVAKIKVFEDCILRILNYEQLISIIIAT